MSRTEEMEQNHPDLDRELAALAAEVPEIPADFHHGWVEAVREEAAQQVKETPRGMARQWRRLAGVAAMMVFLIGGTLLTRGRWTTKTTTVNDTLSIQAAEPAGQSPEAPAAQGTAAPAAREDIQPLEAAGNAGTVTEIGADLIAARESKAMKTAAYRETSADEAFGAPMSYAVSPEADAEEAAMDISDMAAQEEMAAEEAAPEAAEAEADRTETAAGAAEFAAAPQANGAEGTATEANGSVKEAATTAVTVEAAEPAEETGTGTAAATAEAAAPAEKAGAGKAEKAAEEAGAGTAEKAGEDAKPAENGISGFFTDMWQFILHVWPYAAGAVILGGGAWLAFSRKKKP